MENKSNINTITELELANYLLKIGIKENIVNRQLAIWRSEIDRNEDEKEWLEMFQEEIENQKKYEMFCNDLLENIDNYYSYTDPEQ